MPVAKEATMDGIFPIIRAALVLVVAGAVVAFALARRRKRTVTSLGLWAPVAAQSCGPKPGTTGPAS
jgi:hypothetical protein